MCFSINITSRFDPALSTTPGLPPIIVSRSGGCPTYSPRRRQLFLSSVPSSFRSPIVGFTHNRRCSTLYLREGPHRTGRIILANPTSRHRRRHHHWSVRPTLYSVLFSLSSPHPLSTTGDSALYSSLLQSCLAVGPPSSSRSGPCESKMPLRSRALVRS